MADFFVFNRTNPSTSTHRAGVRYSSNATDSTADVIAQYKAAHPVAAGDVLEVVSATAFVAQIATATVVFSSTSPGTVLPTVGS